MSNYEMISMDAVSNTEAAQSIKDKEKKSELTYREDKIKDYLKKFSKMSLKDFNKAKNELEKLEIPRLDEFHIIKILDLMPQSGTELRAIVSHSGSVLVDENVTKVLDLLKQYRK